MKAYIAAIVVIFGALTDWRPCLSAVQYTTAIRAKVKRTLEFVLPDGVKQLAQHYRETFIRSANGSSHKLIEQLDPATGRVVGTKLEVERVPGGILYTVDSEKRTVFLHKGLVKDPESYFALRQRPLTMRREVYLGRTCTVVPITAPVTGEMWIDDSVAFIMFITVQQKLPDGRIQIKTTAATEFELLSAEPDPSLFQPPPDYATVDLR
jgi:hypothetical protein